tara:strand:+ start:312 stop:887 length:576 start_codon:yes stop_codon:yes gene_type:complete
MGRTNYSVGIWEHDSRYPLLTDQVISTIISGEEYQIDVPNTDKLWSRDDLILLFTGESGELDLSQVNFNTSNILELRNDLLASVSNLEQAITTNVNALNSTITTLDDGIDTRFVNKSLEADNLVIGDYKVSVVDGTLSVSNVLNHESTTLAVSQFKVGARYKLQENIDGNITIKSIADDAELFTIVKQEED